MKFISIIFFLLASLKGFSQDSSETLKSIDIFIANHGTFSIDTTKHILIGNPEFYSKSRKSKKSADTLATGILTEYENKNNIQTEIIVLSVVDTDSSITKNWDEYIKRFKDANYLVVVANEDCSAKTNFMLYFYDQRLKGNDIETAYSLTKEKYKETQPRLKHFLYLKK